VNRAYAVIDDFLPHQAHLDLWDAFQETVAFPEKARDWNRVYQLMDGDSPVSSAFPSRKPWLRDGTAGGSQDAPPALRTFSDAFFGLMSRDVAPLSFAPWTGFSLSAWVYRPGSGLDWHSDTGWLAGYIYYAHPVWRPNWGGELLVAEDTVIQSDSPNRTAETACDGGGVFLCPRPNRLVLLRGGTWHCIKKVESAAGEAFRASVSGFFFNTGS